jgi:FkbM family methyltransferase
VSVQTTLPCGLQFRCALPDLVQMYIWLFDAWEPDLTAFITDRLRGGGSFIDVGANVGYFSATAARRMNGGGRVVAIEASPRIFTLLEETVRVNGLQGIVRCVNQAAAAQHGALRVFSGPPHNVGLTTTVAARGFAAESEVPAAPLGDMLNAEEIRTARLVKIDVEGGEPAVLAGLGSFLSACPREVELLVELSPAWWSDGTLTPALVLKPLLDAGLHAYEIHNSYWPWHYLWPRRVQRPRRLMRDLTQRVKRIDLVLSRIDAERL